MSGAAAGVGGGDGYGGLYHGDDPATSDDHLITAFDHDGGGGGFFFQQMASSPCAGDDGGDGGTAPYASIADYLQGFLDPAGLAAHFGNDDAPPLPPSRGADDDAVVAVKQETFDHSRRDDDVVVDGQLAGTAPVTPANSSVLSSSSCEAGGAGADDDEEEPPRRRCGKKGRIEGEDGEQEGEGEADDDANDRNCKRSKEEKTTRGEKKARQPRVAFMTKSEVDHLEDGYRWRKYGQKAVKNSTYPRSYYRCTAARCGVKKRVERSQQDPSTVITTYEGQHTHPSPVGLLRGGGGFLRCPDMFGDGGGGAPACATIDGYAGTLSSFLPLLPPRARGIGGGGLLHPSMRRLLQEQQHHRALSSQYGGVLDFVPSIPR